MHKTNHQGEVNLLRSRLERLNGVRVVSSCCKKIRAVSAELLTTQLIVKPTDANWCDDISEELKLINS
jgi:hypothetical protein